MVLLSLSEQLTSFVHGGAFHPLMTGLLTLHWWAEQNRLLVFCFIPECSRCLLQKSASLNK